MGIVEKFIQQGLSKNISVIMVTNNTIRLDNEKIRILNEFKRINIFSSIDATDELCGVIRAGSTWEQVNENVQQLIDLHKQNPDKFLHTTPHGVVQFGNILQLHEIVQWWHNIAQDEYKNKMYFRIF